MIVCHCNRVTDRQIEAAATAGAADLDAVGAATGAGTCCGACHNLAQTVLDRAARLVSTGRPDSSAA